MAVSNSTSRREIGRQTFIILCLAASAGLSWIVSGKWGLILFGISLLIVIGVSLAVRHTHLHPERRRWLGPLTIIILVGILVLSRLSSFQLRLFGFAFTGGQWVGISYLIFRLIHVVVESKKLDQTPTGDLAAYALFPAALVAGPIHRAPQFLPQLDQPHYPVDQKTWIDHLWRIGVGLTKKLVLASFFGLFALNTEIVNNPHATRIILLVSLLAFGLQLYFDFAGYSDLVIGVTGLVGITLPENFANPYRQSSLTRFWQTWHISLSFWLRDYLFFPISRTLLKRLGRRWMTPIMAVAHLTTMILAGLWHGFSLNYVGWGIWHGVGLFLNAQWSDFIKRRGWSFPPLVGIVITFSFVMFGWVFFAVNSLTKAVEFYQRLIRG